MKVHLFSYCTVQCTFAASKLCGENSWMCTRICVSIGNMRSGTTEGNVTEAAS